MTTDVPENKKRKAEPEPDSAIAPASNLLIKRLSEKAKLPTRGSALAAGYDLYRWDHKEERAVRDADFLR